MATCKLIIDTEVVKKADNPQWCAYPQRGVPIHNVFKYCD